MKSEKLKPTAFLWDESFLWGLMAYKALKNACLPFDLIRAEDIKCGCLKNYAVLFVPGGWASNKLKTLGDKGTTEIKKFVRNGGNYLGFCGGAGLATLDGIWLLNIRRKPTKDRVPSFSGQIHLNITEHRIWQGLNSSPITHHSSPIFHAWWPSQFLIDDKNLRILATYGDALPDSFSSDLNVGDVDANGSWSEMEKIYKINLDPERLKNEPAVVEGNFGKGRVILSLIHFDTPDDANGAGVLKNLWEYLTENSYELKKFKNSKPEIMNLRGLSLFADNNYCNQKEKSSLNELVSSVNDLINLGIRNFLWFWRNPMLLQWRRGVRGLEYCTLYILTKEIALLSNDLTINETKEKMLMQIRSLLIPFVEKANKLLLLERFAMTNGHITYEACDTPQIQEIRKELFSTSKSHGGLFKELISELDNYLYCLIAERQ
ncbi:MAG: hypothetical protein CVV37_03610 [Nitrospira bacterium HGW-Nitrospira-1]|nr:MAG: hypothetical protein CVV37_03610 [Nitrospira bacterium HGW-Nitrospira-1]